MSRPALLMICLALFAGAMLLTRGMIASQQVHFNRPPAPDVVTTPLPYDPHVTDPLLSDPDVAVEDVGRSWGQEQLCGPPDSMQGGSIPTAWCPATADGQNEWIDVRYAEPVQPIAVLIFENLAPGAVSEIEFLRADGQWVTVWGDDPKPVNSTTRIVNAPVDVDFATQRVRVHLLSPMVDYYNEIDAVGLLDEAGQTHWVVAATASSSYAGDSSELRSLSPRSDGDQVPVPHEATEE